MSRTAIRIPGPLLTTGDVSANENGIHIDMSQTHERTLLDKASAVTIAITNNDQANDITAAIKGGYWPWAVNQATDSQTTLLAGTSTTVSITPGELRSYARTCYGCFDFDFTSLADPSVAVDATLNVTLS